MTATHEFLATMVGGKLHTKVTTGRTYYTEIYERAYTATILAVYEGVALVSLTSHDNAPSGYPLAGTQRSHGEGLMRADDCGSPTEFWNRLIALADPEFDEYRNERSH